MRVGPEIAAVGDHAAEPDGHLEEGQPHSHKDDRTVDAREIGHEQEAQPFHRVGQGQAPRADHEQQHEQQGDQDAGGLFDAPGSAPQDHGPGHPEHDPLPEQRLPRASEQRLEGLVRHGGVLRVHAPHDGLGDVGEDPARHVGIKTQDGDRARDAETAGDPPEAFRGQRPEGPVGVGARRAPDEQFRYHERQPHHQRGKDIHEQEGRAPVLARQCGEFPDVAQPDRRAERRRQHAETGCKKIARGIRHVLLRF